jgi:hypothetical protein
MVTAYYNSTSGAFAYSNREWRLLSAAAVAANLARISRVCSFKRPASVLSFAFRHPEKEPPGHVTDRLGETAVLNHPAYVQILDRDRVKSPHQISRHLVMEIFSTARYFQMRLGDSGPLFRAPLRPFPPARKPPLLSLQALQRILEVAWIFDLFSVREYGETGNAYIYSDRLPSLWHRLRSWRFANNQSIPAVDAARDPKLFALSFDRAGEPDSTCPHAWDRKFVAFDRTGPDLLVFLREGVIPVFALESGKSGLLSVPDASKEAFVCFVKAFKRNLLDRPQMALYFWQRASFSQVARLLLVSKGCASDLITQDPFGKSGVIDLAGMFKLTLAGFYKAFVSAKPEFESLDCGIFGMSHGVQCLNHCAGWRDLVKELLLFIGSFHLYRGQPINNTAKFGRERAANARNSIALARPGSTPRAPLRHQGRRVVHCPSGAGSLQGLMLS